MITVYFAKFARRDVISSEASLFSLPTFKTSASRFQSLGSRSAVARVEEALVLRGARGGGAWVREASVVVSLKDRTRWRGAGEDGAVCGAAWEPLPGSSVACL